MEFYLFGWKQAAVLTFIVTSCLHWFLYSFWHVASHEAHVRELEAIPQLADYNFTIITYQGDVSDNGLFCDHILIHAANTGYPEENELFLRRQREWISNFSNDCFIFLTGAPSEFPTYLEAHEGSMSADAWKEILRRVEGKRLRYDAGVYFTKLAFNGLVHKKNGSGVPWVLYTDVDVLFTNKSRGIDSIVQRLEEGLRLGTTTEDRVCGSADMFPCVHQQPHAHLTLDDIALAIAVDNDCHHVWMLNSGSQLWQLGRMHGYLMEADLTLFNDTSLVYSFDKFEQGKFALLIREIFDFDFNRLRAMCSPFEEKTWWTGMEHNEIVVLREFNYTRASTHPVLGGVTHKWFPNGPPVSGPRYVALVNPRWLNSYACAYNWLFSRARSEAMAMHCGDFMAHFNGCDKGEHKWMSFRKRLGETPECIAALPFKTMDNSSEPFEYHKWLAESVDGHPAWGVREPKDRIQLPDSA
eukprot:Gregarina_sp_Poly_1__7943@NODE_453_length_8283_cov_172_211173_g76_i1_p1_GENE_NODE_453_length_8283_cov_172_211173_g76_i1NODE_453_length_8283_cov_172_211173_g76_i1_p1_ORF_typecomplete_len469_score41_18Glyco_transf_34/PF05637_12/0_00028_NODE_453_length_8283_cov_172_211173_g76_i13751781